MSRQVSMWCEVRRHAMWKSRWETYLKLCRTTWDRKWDSQLMALRSKRLPGFYQQQLLVPDHTLRESICKYTKMHVHLCTSSEPSYWCWIALVKLVRELLVGLVFRCGSHLCLLRTCRRSCCTGWNLWTGAAGGGHRLYRTSESTH